MEEFTGSLQLLIREFRLRHLVHQAAVDQHDQNYLVVYRGVVVQPEPYRLLLLDGVESQLWPVSWGYLLVEFSEVPVVVARWVWDELALLQRQEPLVRGRPRVQQYRPASSLHPDQNLVQGRVVVGVEAEVPDASVVFGYVDIVLKFW